MSTCETFLTRTSFRTPQLKMEDAARCVESYLYTFIYYASLMFGTCRMTIASKTHQIVSYTVSSLWCLAIVGNQIDYAMKPWTEERKETRKEDTTFEKIVRLDFWTYSAVCLLGCSFPLVGRKADLKALNDLQTPRNSRRDARRMAVVLFFVVANAMPAMVSYDDFSSVQKKDDAAYNSLFQDVCKLAILTADLQFAWFCWSLGDGFSGLNDRLLRTGNGFGRAYDFAKTDRARSRHFELADEIRRADAAYRTLAEGAKTVNGVCGPRVLANVSCYMFNTICGLFNTISAYRTPGARPAAVAVHLLRAANCAGRITLVCVAASSVADQDERLHGSAQTAREAFGGDCTEMKRFLRRLTYCKVKFNVCGMVIIDKILLSSAVISVISYLVIVLQYNYS